MRDDRMVTQEEFEYYHKRLLEYIGIHDGLILDEENTSTEDEQEDEHESEQLQIKIGDTTEV